jgi:hypothetical protein
MSQTNRQPELPLGNPTTPEALPEKVLAECRQLIARMLRQILQAEKKEARDEQ